MSGAERRGRMNEWNFSLSIVTKSNKVRQSSFASASDLCSSHRNNKCPFKRWRTQLENHYCPCRALVVQITAPEQPPMSLAIVFRRFPTVQKCSDHGHSGARTQIRCLPFRTDNDTCCCPHSLPPEKFDCPRSCDRFKISQCSCGHTCTSAQLGHTHTHTLACRKKYRTSIGRLSHDSLGVI